MCDARLGRLLRENSVFFLLFFQGSRHFRRPPPLSFSVFFFFCMLLAVVSCGSERKLSVCVDAGFIFPLGLWAAARNCVCPFVFLPLSRGVVSMRCRAYKKMLRGAKQRRH